MILRETLIELSEAKLIDSEILMNESKHDSSLYLVGYSIEMALKSKICKIFNFEKGFPEIKNEFTNYKNNLGCAIEKLNDIKNHDLNKLLIYSGQENTVKKELLDEWKIILEWNPEWEYILNIGDKRKNQKIFNSAKKLITLILK